MVILMIIMNLMAGAGNDQSDNLGHVGGGIAGLFWGFAMFPRVKDDLSAKLRKVGLVGISIFFILFAVLLFTVHDSNGVNCSISAPECTF